MGIGDRAWAFLTGVIGLPEDRLLITVLETDDESAELWKARGIPEDRIGRCGAGDNFWSMGPTGPCGPCSEIHYDFGQGQGCGQPGCGPNCENAMNEHGDVCDRFVELWNLVFMQFYHNLDGSRPPLPTPSVDTGMGLERAAVVLQGTDTIYETDLFTPAIRRVEDLSGTGQVYDNGLVGQHQPGWAGSYRGQHEQ